MATDSNQEQLVVEKYRKGLLRSRRSFTTKLKALFRKNQPVDAEFFERLETILIEADLGPALTAKLIKDLKTEAKNRKITTVKELKQLIHNYLFIIYAKDVDYQPPINFNHNGLTTWLIVGVNGSGKTTSIAKLAAYYQAQGLKVAVVAADTFRAGAVEQLQHWAEQLDLLFIGPDKPKQDPASVIYTAIKKARAQNVNLLLCDTAGRLQNKTHLMQELAKVNQVIKKLDSKAPYETLLVLDALTGQNGIRQAEEFTAIAPITGIVLTKMDGEAKGGIIFAIKTKLNLPVKWIGVGEKLTDWSRFNLSTYLNQLLMVDDE